jgi:hypothetical protein
MYIYNMLVLVARRPGSLLATGTGTLAGLAQADTVTRAVKAGPGRVGPAGNPGIRRRPAAECRLAASLVRVL